MDTSPTVTKVNLSEAFGRIHEHWSPRLAAELNGQHVRLAKLQGDFVWHAHEAEDELFLIVRGSLVIELRDREPLHLAEGELAVIPRGVEHRPVAAEECWVLLFEPASTVSTGEAEDARRVSEPPPV